MHRCVFVFRCLKEIIYFNFNFKHEGALYKEVFPGKIEAHLSKFKMAGDLNSRKVSCKWIVVSLLSLLSINIYFFSRNHVHNRIINWYCSSICNVFSNNCSICNSESDPWGILILCFSVKHKNALSPFPMIRNLQSLCLYIARLRV